MKQAIQMQHVAIVALFLISQTLCAATITIFNTGVDGSGNTLAGGSNDPHYVIVAPSQQAVVISTPAAAWITNDADFSPGSKWIGQTADGLLGPSSFYTLRTTFDLSGLDPTTAILEGNWAVDNAGSILLNGSGTGNSLSGDVGSNFGMFHAFSITSGFVSGLNTLEIGILNFGAGLNPSGVRLGFTRAEAELIPIPPAVWLFGSALGLLGWIRRARKG